MVAFAHELATINVGLAGGGACQAADVTVGRLADAPLTAGLPGRRAGPWT